MADIGVGVATFVAFGLYIITALLWARGDTSTGFNSSILDLIWSILLAGLALAGLLLLSLIRPRNWGIGLGINLIILAGSLVQLFFPHMDVDFSGPVRLALLCVFPLLPAVVQRLPVSETEKAPSPQSSTKGETSHGSAPKVERRRYSADPRTVQTWLEVAKAEGTEMLEAAICKAVAQSMLADLCFLVTGPDAQGKMILPIGYDLIREEIVPGVTIDARKVRGIADAIRQGQATIFDNENRNLINQTAFAEVLDLDRTGSMLLLPLATSSGSWGGILLLAPYSSRIWAVEDQVYLSLSTEQIATLLMKPRKLEDLQVFQVQEPAEGVSYEKGHEETSPVLTGLGQPGDLEDKNSGRQAPTDTRVDDLLLDQRETRNDLIALQREVDELRSIMAAVKAKEEAGAETERIHLQTELRAALEDVARLQVELANANMKLHALEVQSRSSSNAIPESLEMIAAIGRDLRQPMASIVGYTDLLLSESAGILAALQRKFLDRINNAIERMNILLDDLLRLTSQDAGISNVVSQKIKLSNVIDEAIAETSPSLREKRIALRVDLPEELPDIKADQDALLQIIVHLLQNAGAASPVDGTVSLLARLEETELGQSYLLLQVTDSGCGISPDDIQKVLTRRYRDDNVQIPGVGEAGVGLSIAKTLTEAHGGRIWVDGNPGKGATFSILLPIANDSGARNPENGT